MILDFFFDVIVILHDRCASFIPRRLEMIEDLSEAAIELTLCEDLIVVSIDNKCFFMGNVVGR